MWAGQGADLCQKRRTDTHAHAGAASQARAYRDGRSHGVHGAGALRRPQGEEEVEEGGSGVDVNFALLIWLAQ